MTRALGWVDPVMLNRVHRGRVTAPAMALSLPSHVRLATPEEVLNQHGVGRCVAEALVRGVEVVAPRCGYAAKRPDRTALYYRVRRAIGTIARDSGGLIADGVEALRDGWEDEQGDPSPIFDDSYLAPPRPLPDDAPRLLSAEPLVVSDSDSMMWELACGHPVVAGVRVTEQWTRADGEERIGDPEGDDIGGHAILITGYRTDGELVDYLHDGSWGPSLGRNGRIWLPSSWFSLRRCGEIHALRAIRMAP